MASENRRSGAVAARVAANVRLIRNQRGLTSYQLSAKLDDIGWPIAQSGIVRIEGGQRAVSVDDLVALALALDTSPNALLFPAEVTGNGTDQYPWPILNDKTPASQADMWRWADGDDSLERKEDGVYRPAPAGTISAQRMLEAAPHRYIDVRNALRPRRDDRA